MDLSGKTDDGEIKRRNKSKDKVNELPENPCHKPNGSVLLSELGQIYCHFTGEDKAWLSFISQVSNHAKAYATESSIYICCSMKMAFVAFLVCRILI